MWYPPAIEEYLKKGDLNVIAIDWNGPASEAYWDSVDHTKAVAKLNAQLILEIKEKFGVPLKNFHLIGHSLGAHISGLTGQRIQELTGNKIGRITGLDPAGPFWNGKSEDERLSADDADYVDAIHTDGNLLGYGERLGDADYFPNGGVSSQPGCGLTCKYTVQKFGTVVVHLVQKQEVRVLPQV